MIHQNLKKVLGIFLIPLLSFAYPCSSQIDNSIRCSSYCCQEKEPCQISDTGIIVGAAGAGLAIGAIVGALIGKNHSSHRGHSGSTGSKGSGPIIPNGNSGIEIIFSSTFGRGNNGKLTLQPYVILPDLQVLTFDPYTMGDYPTIIRLPPPNQEGAYIVTLKVLSIDIPSVYPDIIGLVGIDANPQILISFTLSFPPDPLTEVGSEQSAEFVYSDALATP